MSAASMATARLMETWAHGQDVADALGVPAAPTARLRHVAHLGVRTRDFAYVVHGPAAAGRAVPGGADRRRTASCGRGAPRTPRSGSTGPALDFCLLVTQRRHRDDLAAAGRRGRTPTSGWTSPRPSPARPGRAPGRRAGAGRVTRAAADRQRLRVLRRPVRAVREMLDRRRRSTCSPATTSPS